jgi:hypothetical protein
MMPKKYSNFDALDSALTHRRVMDSVLRFKLWHCDVYAEAEANDVPFTPIWWWWNADADEYIMTLWDTNAGKDNIPMYSFGASDPAGTWGKPTKMIAPLSYRKAIRKLTGNK